MAFPLSRKEHAAIRDRIEGQLELIVAAAIRVQQDGQRPIILFCERPGRHGDVIGAAGQLSGDRMRGGEHGFITNYGRFVDREEAAALVVANLQGSPRVMPGYTPSLHSEDMWNEPISKLPSNSGGA